MNHIIYLGYLLHSACNNIELCMLSIYPTLKKSTKNDDIVFFLGAALSSVSTTIFWYQDNRIQGKHYFVLEPAAAL